jgi:phosphohistidine swiveling domain-containing protein
MRLEPIGGILSTRRLRLPRLPRLDPAALVTEKGGPLDHVAEQARERGIPTIVGADGASALADGELVLVDADEGMVVRLERAVGLR